MTRPNRFFTSALISRLLVLIIDVSIVAVTFLFANMLRFNFSIPEGYQAQLPQTLVLVVGVRTIFFYMFKTYAGVIKFTSEQDAVRVFLAVISSSLVLGFMNKFIPHEDKFFFYPISIIIIDFFLAAMALVAYKVSAKIIGNEIKSVFYKKPARANVIIFGSGEEAILAKKAIENDPKSNMNVVAFVHDDLKLIGQRLDGDKIYHSLEIEALIDKLDVNSVILSENIASNKQDFVDVCLKKGVSMKLVPPVNKWLHGELHFNQIKNIKIEDLLDREPINLDNGHLLGQVKGKTVLISGAAGSIGSEIVRQLTHFQPKLLILVDIAESPLVELSLEIEEQVCFHHFVPILADISDKERMEHVFDDFKPDIVYHAAAYKHVPIIENVPFEAIRVNVKGTRNLADLSVKYQVDRFVMISTDKAVNPTNVMGCSKRIAEIYCQSINNSIDINQCTKFITTRFGNVLGSNGSVIPRFKKQIEIGGPVTVTHPDITRYFMTIPEACQLVLEAGSMGEGGEIFIFDMGKSVKVLDLAERMVRLSGLEPYVDIDIVFSGLRPGEKIEEELLAKTENIIPTHHHKIMRAKVREYNFEQASREIDELMKLAISQDEVKIVGKMKKIVPEYISNNSVFEALDNLEPATKIVS